MSKDSKISFFLPSLRGGGAEKSLLNLAKGFAAKGFMVDLVLAKKTGVYLSDVPKDVNIIDLHSNRLTLALFPLIQYLKKENPKALISAMPHVNLVSLTAQKFSGFPGKIVVTEQNFFSIDQRSVGLIKRNITRFLVKKLYPKAAAVVPISSGVALDLSRISRIAEKDLHIIHNPMDIKDIEKKSHSDISHKWFSNNHIKVILGVGRLTDQRTFRLLLMHLIL
jgi:glycosyltransferase involved in cell wall biosynthesis